MKLLFDHNISPDLIERLADLFPGSNHVYLLALYEEDDPVVWAYAQQHDFIVVSKDADFSELSMLRGFPPKLVWLRIGNCRTDDVEAIIRANFTSIVQLVEDPERGILVLFRKDGG